MLFYTVDQQQDILQVTVSGDILKNKEQTKGSPWNF